MFAEKFGSLITKYPQEADALSRLADYFEREEIKRGDDYRKLRLEPARLFDIAQAGSTSRLAKVIEVLVQEHILQRLLIVVSPSGGGIATYFSYSEIPDVLHDDLADVQLEVSLENIRTVYTPAE